METEEWIILASLTGEFYITDEHVTSDTPLIDGLKRFSITPVFSEDGKYTGIHKLEAALLMDNKKVDPLESRIIYDHARKIIDSITARVSLVIGRPVLISGGISVKHQISVIPSRYRMIIGAGQSASIAPPVPLPAQLLAMSISPKIQRVIRWFAHGLSSNDTIDKLIALNNALDILSCMIDGAPDRSRKCKKCGSEETIGPGLRERVLYYLTNILGINQEDAISIYESRLDLAHGRSNLSEEDIRHFREQSIIVTNAVRNGIAKSLSINLPTMPEPNPFDISSALMDIVCNENDISN
jgi:hypothetical protein